MVKIRKNNFYLFRILRGQNIKLMEHTKLVNKIYESPLAKENIRTALLMAVGQETAYDPETYSGGLDEHCFAVAYVIKNLLGGQIVCGKVNGERHAWNKLENGELVDFSSCQFGGVSACTKNCPKNSLSEIKIW